MSELIDPIYEESHLKVLRLLEADPSLSQRSLSHALGISLGKTNHCVRALLDKGLIKMQNFRNGGKKSEYSYFLTSDGVSVKNNLINSLLALKKKEFQKLKREIEDLQNESNKL